MLLSIWNCVCDYRNLFQKRKNWQGFLNVSTIVCRAPQMIHTQRKMWRAVLLLNLFSQWWFVGNFSVSFHKCHINSSYRSKTKLTLSSWPWHPVSDGLGYAWMRFVHHTALWNVKLPRGWTAVCSSVYFPKECQRHSGKGKCWHVLPCLQDTDGPGAFVALWRWGSRWAARHQRLMKPEKGRGRSWYQGHRHTEPLSGVACSLARGLFR